MGGFSTLGIGETMGLAIQTDAETLRRLHEAAQRTMTKQDEDLQRISWCVGQTGMTREQAIKALRKIGAIE